MNFVGGLKSVILDQKALFSGLLRFDVYDDGWLLVHSQPSGCTPSEEDMTATLRLAHIGLAIGVPLVDHWIIGPHPEQKGWMAFSFLCQESGFLDPEVIIGPRGTNHHLKGMAEKEREKIRRETRAETGGTIEGAPGPDGAGRSDVEPDNDPGVQDQ